MKTKKIWANLGVEDLDRTTKFYTELGFKPPRWRELVARALLLNLSQWV